MSKADFTPQQPLKNLFESITDNSNRLRKGKAVKISKPEKVHLESVSILDVEETEDKRDESSCTIQPSLLNDNFNVSATKTRKSALPTAPSAAPGKLLHQKSSTIYLGGPCQSKKEIS